MYPILFQLGHFEFRSYGAIVALAFFVGLWLATREAERNGLQRSDVQDFVSYALLGGVIGARLYYVVFSQPDYFLQNPWAALAVWQGGIGVIGSLLGGLVAALWYTRRKNLSFLRFADTLAPAIPLGQTIGQFACLLNGDSYGKPTDLPWAITYTDPRSLAPLNIPLHPIEIYEMVGYFLVFLLVWKTRKLYKAEGSSFLTYLTGYGAARFFVEFFRGQPAIFAWNIPAAQVFSILLILSSVAGFYLLRPVTMKASRKMNS
ncbi:MAG: prolipoprotein diacylglyceryl transferase [Alphaproteobacteria bacterium]